MADLVTYELVDGIAVLTMDDGKANVMSPAMLGELDSALDRAEKDEAIVVLTGRPGVFSGGFDLKVLKGGGAGALGMLRSGFLLSARMLSFPYPIVVACTGHAIAMGAFVVLSGDYRVGANGEFVLRANEVAIGLTMPRAALAICRQRLSPAHFERVTLLSEPYTPEAGVAAGFLDRVAPAGDVHHLALSYAQGLKALDMKAHHRSKLRSRGSVISEIRSATRKDLVELSTIGLRQVLQKKMSR